ncbi:hypothetical protein RF679_05730 [Undibacterium cyanobacteriorum]|uniref:Peptidase M10 metallopeptidase domain-containing protein n=1 Tax=Undibacterium cyanobacteriorum TaxID=3073561 RepID=A0ABY9RM73_9BURK|nr:hypothetical protein [Undibacterium sp. 20NA77.5]WMW81780.1 hypothetical protein RF679_05730 [Undibacterium sp. 20NA77.5]
MFKYLRIGLLLIILGAVAISSYRARTKSVEWQYTLMVNVYPINGDQSAASEDYIRQLKREDFVAIEEFIQREKAKYGKADQAGVEIRLMPQLKEGPPAPPAQQNPLKVMWWSLKFRWWAYQNAKLKGPGPQVRLFVQYFDPAKSQVHHSTALQEGLIGRVNLFASKELSPTNNVVIAHEMLHTLGATDKYDLANDYPDFPDGFAEPQRQPILPQRFAEIMGGRIPVSTQEAIIPMHLGLVRLGKKTAEEINLLPKPNS